MIDKVTTTDVKKFNKNRIFRLIHNTDKISRQEIADILQLSLPTVNQNLKILTDMNLIRFGGNFESTGGRKAQVISINGNAKYAVSVNISNLGIKVSLINLKGDIICSEKKTQEFAPTDKYGITVNELVHDIIVRNNVKDDDVLGVGITFPGILDKDNMVILSAPTIGIKNYSIDMLIHDIPYPCCAMNDARASAYAEFWFKHRTSQTSLNNIAKYHGSMIKDNVGGKTYLMLNDGVGGCYIDRGVIESGEHNRFGEFGHMTIHPNGKKCNCGKNGCLEAYVSSARLSTDFGISLDEFFYQLRIGNNRFAQVFEEYVDNLTTGINNIYLMCDGDVILGGPVSKYLIPYKGKIKSMLIDKYCFDTDGSYFEFAKCSQEQTDAGAALTYIGDFINRI